MYKLERLVKNVALLAGGAGMILADIWLALHI